MFRLCSLLFAAITLQVSTQAVPFQNGERIARIVDEIREANDGASRRLFEELGRMKTFDAFKALELALGEMQREGSKRPIFQAMRHFVGVDEGDLGQRVIDRVARYAQSKTAGEAQAAASALKGFGAPAHEALFEVAEDSPDEKARAHAIGGIRAQLAKRADDDALEIVLGGVSVPESGSRPEVLDLLRSFRSEDAFEEFAKTVQSRRATDARKKLILAAVGGMKLGTSDVIDVGGDEVLSKAANQRDPILQYYALTAMARRGGTFDTRLVEKLSGSKDPTVRHAAHLVLFLVGAKDANPIVLAQREDPIARQASAIALGDRADDESLEALHGLMADDHRVVRAEAIRQIGGRRDVRSVPLLIDRLDRETGRMRADVRDALEVITARDYGLNASVWRRFWEAEGDTFAVPAAEEVTTAREERAKTAKPNRSAAAFYGIDIVSEQFALAIDTSGSMAEQANTSTTRLAVAKEQLLRTLERLQDGVLFNIIPFSGGARAMEDDLMTMGPDVKAEATEFVGRLRAVGGTNIHDALQAAFADERVDTIYLMTDGDPSAGPIIDSAQLREEVARWNVVRGIVIHCVAVGQDRDLLKGLAEDSGGRYIRVN